MAFTICPRISPKSVAKKLSTQHSKFCLLMAGGNINQTMAYMECYPDSTYDSARRSASDLLTNPDIEPEIQRVKNLTETSKVMSRTEKREFLADVKRTAVGDIDESSPLAQEVIRTVTTHRDGETSERKQIKMMGKQAAIDIDNKMQGHYEPDVIEHNINITWGEGK